MINFKKIAIAIAVLLSCICWQTALGQHTIGFTAGYGSASGRMDPKQSSRGLWGIYTGALSWRHYTAERYVGGFGLDLEFIQQGFSFAPFASTTENKEDYRYYTRRTNTMQLPIVWQPHVYMIRNHVRVYLEAAATFSYQLSSSYENEVARDAGEADWRGDYPYKLARDNRWGYGLAGGGGIAILLSRFEINFRVRYYFGLSDLVRNRTVYADNSNDGSENPFWASPLRSPMDNLTISAGLTYRFNKTGFDSWKPREKREKNREKFKY